MTEVTQMIPSKPTEAEKRIENAPTKSSKYSTSAWSACCGLRLENPVDVIRIYVYPPDDIKPDMQIPRFWTGSPIEEDMFSQGLYILIEVENKSNLIFKTTNRKVIEKLEILKFLIPTRTAERVGFFRLANVGTVIQKTPTCTLSLKKVTSEEDCKGSTAVHFNDQVYKLDTKLHHKVEADSSNASSVTSDIKGWSFVLGMCERSFQNLFTFKGFMLMLISHCGLSLLNRKFNILENDFVKDLMKEGFASIAHTINYFFHKNKSPRWYEGLFHLS